MRDGLIRRYFSTKIIEAVQISAWWSRSNCDSTTRGRQRFVIQFSFLCYFLLLLTVVSTTSALIVLVSSRVLISFPRIPSMTWMFPAVSKAGKLIPQANKRKWCDTAELHYKTGKDSSTNFGNQRRNVVESRKAGQCAKWVALSARKFMHLLSIISI